MKALRPTGGLMLRRDGSGLPWGGKGEMLTQVERISKKIIMAAGLRPELTFTSSALAVRARRLRLQGKNLEADTVANQLLGVLARLDEKRLKTRP